jgi:hypothetical protein
MNSPVPFTQRNAVIVSLLLAGAAVAAPPPIRNTYHQQTAPTSPLKLLFTDEQDVFDVWGSLKFGASPLRPVGECEDPGFEIKCCVPRPDGSWEIYGYTGGHDIYGESGDPTKQRSVWKIHRATTRDGVHYEDRQVVFTSEPGAWTHYATIGHNPVRNELVCIKGVLLREGFCNNTYHSHDGQTWTPGTNNPVYYDGDSWGQLWSPRLNRFVTTTKSFQIVKKHLPDHGNTRTGQVRRVCSVRWSEDGDHWEPSDPVLIHNGSPLLPVDLLVTPDQDDPPDLEFYRGVGFGYADRCFVQMLNYAAIPDPVNPKFPDKHGPQLDTEWWFSREGIKWRRPFRDLDATPDGVRIISHNPMIIGGKLLFNFGNRLFGLPEDRITYLAARANAEFSTGEFTAPARPLMLNAAIPSPDRLHATNQCYVMVAALDDQGRVIAGYEREHCILRNGDAIDLPMRWGNQDTSALVGKKIRLRFFLRSARIYSVRESPLEPNK